MSAERTVRVGTRGSGLALVQTEEALAELRRAHPERQFAIVTLKTQGDLHPRKPLVAMGHGVFVKELEVALLEDEIDIAVHSMKDVPTFFPDGLHLACITKREDARDALLTRNNVKFKDLPQGANVGTSSLRRQAQLMGVRPDFVIHQLRGNVDTRIRKLKEGQYDAIILAAAGVKRLGLSENVSEYIDPEISLPAIGQGALGIECRVDDRELNDMIAFFNHADTRTAVTGERSLLRRLEGGCQVPIACYGQMVNGTLKLVGLVGSVDGKKIIKDSIEGAPDQAEKLGKTLAEKLLSLGADVILREVYGNTTDFSGNNLLES